MKTKVIATLIVYLAAFLVMFYIALTIGNVLSSAFDNTASVVNTWLTEDGQTDRTRIEWSARVDMTKIEWTAKTDMAEMQYTAAKESSFAYVFLYLARFLVSLFWAIVIVAGASWVWGEYQRAKGYA